MFQIVLLTHELFKEADSLRNKRFRVVSKQRKTRGTKRNGIFGCPRDFSCGL